MVQFGEGNFLRAFVDYIINKLNEEAGFNAGVAVVQPISSGLVNILNEQDGSVSSNSIFVQKMPDIVDIDSGGVIRAEKTIEEMGEEILEYLVEVASGNIISKADSLNQDDFIPWKRGVSL